MPQGSPVSPVTFQAFPAVLPWPSRFDAGRRNLILPQSRQGIRNLVVLFLSRRPRRTMMLFPTLASAATGESSTHSANFVLIDKAVAVGINAIEEVCHEFRRFVATDFSVAVSFVLQQAPGSAVSCSLPAGIGCSTFLEL